MFYLFTDHPFALQAGFGASGRYFKRAVDRNRIKRLSREAWRLQKKGLEEKLVNQQQRLAVFLIYNGKELPLYDQAYGKITTIIQKLSRIADENNPSHT